MGNAYLARAAFHAALLTFSTASYASDPPSAWKSLSGEQKIAAMTGLQEGLLLAEAGPVHFQPGIDCASDWKPQDMAKVLDAQAPEAKLGEIALKASSLIGCQNRPELGGPKQPYRASDYKKLGKKARRLFVEQAISGLKTSPFFAQCRSLRNGFSARFEEQIQSDPTGKTIVALAVAGYATCPDSPSLPTQ